MGRGDFILDMRVYILEYIYCIVKFYFGKIETKLKQTINEKFNKCYQIVRIGRLLRLMCPNHLKFMKEYHLVNENERREDRKEDGGTEFHHSKHKRCTRTMLIDYPSKI